MKGILRIVMGIFIFSIVTMLLFGGNNKYSRQQLTAKFHKTIETKKQIENDRRILPKIDDSHLTIGQTGYHKPDEKMQKKNESPGAKMARHQERMINLEASGTSSEQIIQILKKEKRATGTGSISGSVYQTDGITPLDHSIRIYAYDEYGYYIGDCYLSTGNTVYIIEELPSGLYYLRTSSSYYINEYYDNTISWHEATLVQVVDAQVTSGIDFYLEKSKVIIGYIYEEDGTTPISNMYARFYCYDATSEYDQWDYNYFSRNLTEDGEFILSGISFPEVKIKAFIEGYKPEFHNNADTWDNASGITVTGMNDTIININFFLSPVTAVQDSYEPNNTHFNAYEITYGDTVNPQINPEYDIDYFKFVGQEDDTVTISIFADIYGSGLYPFLYLIDSTGTDRLDKCDGRDSKITNYVLPYTGLYFLKIRDDLYRGGENCSYLLTIIKGTVFIEGISGAISGRIYEPDGITPYIGYASIDAYDTITGDDVSDDFISSSDSGLYTISDLPAGDYKIRIYSWSDIYLRQWYNGVQNWEEAAIVSVMDRDTTSDVNITLEYGGLISGRIYQSDGITPYIGSAEIDAYDAITSDYVSDDYISSSDSGCYTFGELAGGNYKIRIYIYDDSDTYTNQWYNGVQNREEATNVLVNIPDTTKNINFTLKQGGTIQGFIYSTDGSERITEDSLDVSVIFYNSVTGKYAGYGYNTFTGGYKETGLWPGSYKIATTGFSSNLAPVFYGGGTVYDDPNSSTITLVAGEVKDIDLNIATANGKISGVVYDRNGNPFAGNGDLAVVAYDPSGYIVQATWVGWDINTNEDLGNGKYTITGLRTGNYYLMLLVADCEDYEDQIFWYDNIMGEFSSYYYDYDFYTLDIPSNATAVFVNENEETPNINFHVGTTGIDESDPNRLPSKYVLSQNYPNPFNPITTFRYNIPKRSNVTLNVYDITGRLVKTLVGENKEPGYYSVHWDASQFSSGVYLYRIQTKGFHQVKKCLLIK